MKLEKILKCENKKLYFIDGGAELKCEGAPVVKADDFNSGNVPADSVFGIEVPFASVGTEDDGYNEEFLAKLRDGLKAMEEKKQFAFIVPSAAEEIASGKGETVTASYKHCARRIKDATSVAGFAVPEGVDKAFFIEELSAKHAQYVYFSKTDSDENLVRF